MGALVYAIATAAADCDCCLLIVLPFAYRPVTSDAVYGGTLVHSWSIQTTAAPTAAGETAGIWQEVHTVAAVVVALLALVLCFQGGGNKAWCWLHVKGTLASPAAPTSSSSSLAGALGAAAGPTPSKVC